ncbi:uncharacterized protein LOC112493060 [Ziziphus jujuba]|uniref:Uncharacterized protein LOC112493060 n=1 Tax=Ziziphus jujuba TaxID=326968 RepID=A0A6P6GHT5_ZIZJJ|nr:uncharacterized protein LOC112493060 [Ziziphus jujuba]
MKNIQNLRNLYCTDSEPTRIYTKNPFPSMPLIPQHPIFLELLKLSATLCTLFIFCPFLFLVLVLIFFSIFLILPFVYSIIWAVFLWKILFMYPIRFFEMKLMKLLISRKPNKCDTVISKNEEEEEDVDDYEVFEVLKEKQESVELDPMEFPSFYETDDDEGKGINENNKLCSKEEDSWHILVPKSMKIEEYKPFYEILTFWKRKEKGDA